MRKVLIEFLDDLQRPDVLWQVGTVLACILVARWLSVPLRGWLAKHRQPAEGSGRLAAPVSAGLDALQRVAWPLLSMLLILAARPVLDVWHHVNLLRLAVPLLGSLALVRTLSHMVQRGFRRSTWAAPLARLVAVLVWTGVALHIAGLDEALLEALETTRVPLGKHKVSVLVILQALASAAVTLLAALWAGSALEARLMRSETLDPSLRAVFARFGRAVLLLVAVLMSLSAAGLDLTVLSVFGGALGVGLGLGLQRIASNYVSGFIILLDRGLRLGDLITVDKYSGRVTQIKTRYTVLRALDGTEALIPNEVLVAQAVLNQSFSDTRLRVVLPVALAYGTDLDRAGALMRGAALAQARVLAEPAPAMLVTGFTLDGITTELGFWIQDPEAGVGGVRSEVARAVLAVFAAEGIRIPHAGHAATPAPPPPGADAPPAGASLA